MSKPRCPFLETPCEECYVKRLTSTTIERAILYCGGDYERCEVYRRLVGRQRREGSQAGERTPGAADPR